MGKEKNQPDMNEMAKVLADKKRKIEERCLQRINDILKEECCVLGIELQLIPIGENLYKNAGRIKITHSG